MLRLNPAGMYAVGVHLDPAVTTFVVLDLVGAVVQHSRIKTPDGTDPGAVIAAIAAEIEQLIADSGVDRDQDCRPGRRRSRARSTLTTARWWTRRSCTAGTVFRSGTRWRRRRALSVLVDKDVTSAAVAETWAGGPSGAGSFVFMYMGTGIGCGIVLNDEVVRGTSGNAGEIGHIIVDPDGPPCDCGMRGCVKSSCIPQVLVAQAASCGHSG